MSVKFKKGIDLQGQRATGAADASSATDLVTYQQLQAFVRGLDWKDAVVAASTGNVTLATPGTTLDGVTLVSGNRILLKNQSAGAENGPYIWTGAASLLTRAPDADASAEVTSGMAITVTGGTANLINGLPTSWVLTTADPIVLNTTALVFAMLGGGSTPYTGGAGLTLSGSTFNVGQGTGITVNADDVAVDTAVVSRIYQADCAATTNPQVFTHSLGKRPLVQVIAVAANEVVYPDLVISTTTITVDWGSAPTAAEYRVIAVG